MMIIFERFDSFDAFFDVLRNFIISFLRNNSFLMSTYFSPAPKLYCEGEYFKMSFVEGTTTEIVNSVSSLFIIFFGLWGLFRNTRNGMVITLLNALLVVTGIGSTLYHATFYLGFSFLDSFPMTMCLSIGIAALLDEIIVERDKIRGTWKSRLAGVSTFLALAYGVAVMTIDATSIASTVYFQVLFALPFIALVGIFVYYYLADLRQGLIPGTDEDRKAIRGLIVRSLVLGFIGLALWLLDGALCDTWEPIVFFFGHAVWHIMMGYSVMCIFAFISYLRADNFNNRASIAFAFRFFLLLPIVSWRQDIDTLCQVLIT